MDNNVVMMGATGAVGSEALKKMLVNLKLKNLTLLGRRSNESLKSNNKVAQHIVNILNPDSYTELLKDHDTAICTLGVGQPSKVSKEDFLKIDKYAVFDFATRCRDNGIKHFILLASVGIDANSRSFYLRSKGELVEALKALKFDRLSIFKPSMILTPTNRYGFTQWLSLKITPLINPFLFGSIRKYKGIKVEKLGGAIGNIVFTNGNGYEELYYDDFIKMG